MVALMDPHTGGSKRRRHTGKGTGGGCEHAGGGGGGHHRHKRTVQGSARPMHAQACNTHTPTIRLTYLDPDCRAQAEW